MHGHDPPFYQFDTGQAQVLAKASIKARTVQQELDVLRMLLSIPGHLALRRQRRAFQCMGKPRAAQGIEHSHRYAFERRKSSPVTDQRHVVAKPSQAQRHRRPGRTSTKNQHRAHAQTRRSGP
ncbi:hypothetical protein D3C79_622160 [compost metagenome]